MLILALDTSTRAGSCALTRDGELLREEASDSARPPAARLPGELIALLERARVPLDRVDVFAVSTGPGSFTGLRIGIATMQGLALAMGKPLIGISAFDALARIASGRSGRVTQAAPPEAWPRSGHEPDPVRDAERAPARASGERTATWVDAWRGEVYAAVYEDGRNVAAPAVAHPSELLPPLVGRPTVFIGDGAAAHRDLIRATLGDEARFADPLVPLLAHSVARLAAEAARAGLRPPPHAIRPLYVRRPDAEAARDAARAFTAREAERRGPPPMKYWIEPLASERDLDGVLEVEAESFTNPWTRQMYAWELQNRAVCHIYVVRTDECPVAGFCAFWLVFDEIHINNLALRPHFRAQGIGSALLSHVLAEARRLGARRATLEVRASNAGARRLYARFGFYVAGTRRSYYSNPVEDALILWRDDAAEGSGESGAGGEPTADVG